ncbi:hypothetical protein IDM32_15885 [Acinetobacter seifertii]|nr:hypothetical protein [Acinetobacter seifertii]
MCQELIRLMRNVSQLDALSTSSNNKTDALGNSTANNLGGGASYDSTTGAVSSPTYVTTKLTVQQLMLAMSVMP